MRTGCDSESGDDRTARELGAKATEEMARRSGVDCVKDGGHTGARGEGGRSRLHHSDDANERNFTRGRPNSLARFHTKKPERVGQLERADRTKDRRLCTCISSRTA